MRIRCNFLFIILLISIGTSSFPSGIEDFSHVPLRRKLRYAEEFYLLFRENLHRGTENLNANIYWLMYALKSPLAHPVKAFAKIESRAQWKKYKNLFHFQIYYLITETYLRLGERYEKPNLLFFNKRFKKEIKEGLLIAQIYYKRAAFYWEKAVALSKICWEERDIPLRSLNDETDKWINRVYQVTFNKIEMNYPKEIKKRLEEVQIKLDRLEKGDFNK